MKTSKITFKTLKRIIKESLEPETIDDVKVGDILYTLWGYDMIIVDFYQVISRTPSTLLVRPLEAHMDGGFTGYCTPIRNKFKGDKTIRVRRSTYGIKIENHYARIWDGKPIMYDHLD